LKDPLTFPLADLLLTKLQIVEINIKNVKDISAILLEHALGDNDIGTVNVNRIIEVTSNDRGFNTTVCINLEKIPTFLDTLELSKEQNLTIKKKLVELAGNIHATPKSTNWKLRSILGKSKIWYEEPEDAARDELKLE
jgi:hypothetical protein